DRVVHLHRLDDDQLLALVDQITVHNGDIDDRTGQWRDDRDHDGRTGSGAGRLAAATSPSDRPRTVRHSQGSACWCTQTRSARIAVTSGSGRAGGSGTRHESSNPGRPSPWARAWATRSCPALLPCNRSSLHKRGSEPSVKAATSTIMTPARRAASRRASLNSTTRGCITRVNQRFGVGSGRVNVSTSTPTSAKVANIRSTRPAVASG